MSELPEGWVRITLGELGTWRGGGTPSKSKADFWRGAIPWVSPKDMKTDLIFDTEDHITAEAVRMSATQIIPRHSILIVTRSGILRRTLPVGVTTCEAAINQDIKALTPHENIDSEFIARQLRAYSYDVLSQCAKSGTTVDSVDFEKLKAYPIALAPQPEQHRIVAKLGSLFERTRRAREELSHVPRLIENYKKAILEAAFRGDLTKQFRKNNNLPAWETRPLHSLIADGPTNGYSPRAGDNPSGTLSLKLTATTRGFLDLSEKAIKRLSDVIPEDSQYWLQDGDILVQRANSLAYVGATAIFRGPQKTYTRLWPFLKNCNSFNIKCLRASQETARGLSCSVSALLTPSNFLPS